MKNVLVIAAHPDDETLGVGGTMAKHILSSDNVKVVLFSRGVSSRSYDSEILRLTEFDNALKLLGLYDKRCINYNLPDQELDTISILKITRIIEDAQVRLNMLPDIVYTHYSNDLNQDHRRLYYATVIAFRPKPGQLCKEIYGYYVPTYGNTGRSFNPNMYVELNQVQAELKLAAVDCYNSEHNDRFNRDIVKAQLHECGNSIGCNYAESFEIVRIIR